MSSGDKYLLFQSLRIALIFALPAFIVAIAAHLILPHRTKTIWAVLTAIEIAGVLFLFYEEARRRGTGLEILPLPGELIGILIGNLLAPPVTRRIRSTRR